MQVTENGEVVEPSASSKFPTFFATCLSGHRLCPNSQMSSQTTKTSPEACIPTFRFSLPAAAEPVQPLFSPSPSPFPVNPSMILGFVFLVRNWWLWATGGRDFLFSATCAVE